MKYILMAWGDVLPAVWLLLVMWLVTGAPTRRRRR